MSRKEVSKKFDEIVAFSEVEEFIDTPVKRYSSGMYVRLAFSVAAHLEPEILIVDEVLAVGDAAFQKKCIEKMDEANSNGRTILIVSHNMAMLSNLCKTAVVLSDGKVSCAKKEISEAVQTYLKETEKVTEENIFERKDRKGEGKIKITNFSILGPEKTIQKNYLAGQEIIFKIEFQTLNNNKYSRVDFNIAIKNPQKGLFSLLSSDMTGQTVETLEGNGTYSCIVKKLPLAPGSYILNLSVRSAGVVQDWIQEIAILNVIEGDFYSTGRLYDKSHMGFYIEHSWEE
jgi:lipopolysaccharide transport system ATP-binding protein